MRNYFRRRARKCVSFVRRHDFFYFQIFFSFFLFFFEEYLLFTLNSLFLFVFCFCFALRLYFLLPCAYFLDEFFPLENILSKRERRCGCFCWQEIVFFFSQSFVARGKKRRHKVGPINVIWSTDFYIEWNFEIYTLSSYLFDFFHLEMTSQLVDVQFFQNIISERYWKLKYKRFYCREKSSWAPVLKFLTYTFGLIFSIN